ncbi:MAG: hypothetical protein E7349_00375 [Clostridiales bacterium]|nr:hypothetical protein [Clostridiales bacterium]
MNIFKKLFSKLQKKKEKQEECWYNNYPEKEKGIPTEPMENVALCAPNSIYYTSAQEAAKHQN